MGGFGGDLLWTIDLPDESADEEGDGRDEAADFQRAGAEQAGQSAGCAGDFRGVQRGAFERGSADLCGPAERRGGDGACGEMSGEGGDGKRDAASGEKAAEF